MLAEVSPKASNLKSETNQVSKFALLIAGLIFSLGALHLGARNIAPLHRDGRTHSFLRHFSDGNSTLIRRVLNKVPHFDLLDHLSLEFRRIPPPSGCSWLQLLGLTNQGSILVATTDDGSGNYQLVAMNLQTHEYAVWLKDVPDIDLAELFFNDQDQLFIAMCYQRTLHIWQFNHTGIHLNNRKQLPDISFLKTGYLVKATSSEPSLTILAKNGFESGLYQLDKELVTVATWKNGSPIQQASKSAVATLSDDRKSVEIHELKTGTLKASYAVPPEEVLANSLAFGDRFFTNSGTVINANGQAVGRLFDLERVAGQFEDKYVLTSDFGKLASSRFFISRIRSAGTCKILAEIRLDDRAKVAFSTRHSGREVLAMLDSSLNIHTFDKDTGKHLHSLAYERHQLFYWGCCFTFFVWFTAWLIYSSKHGIPSWADQLVLALAVIGFVAARFEFIEYLASPEQYEWALLSALLVSVLWTLYTECSRRLGRPIIGIFLVTIVSSLVVAKLASFWGPPFISEDIREWNLREENINWREVKYFQMICIRGAAILMVSLPVLTLCFFCFKPTSAAFKTVMGFTLLDGFIATSIVAALYGAFVRLDAEHWERTGVLTSAALADSLLWSLLMAGAGLVGMGVILVRSHLFRTILCIPVLSLIFWAYCALLPTTQFQLWPNMSRAMDAVTWLGTMFTMSFLFSLPYAFRQWSSKDLS